MNHTTEQNQLQVQIENYVRRINTTTYHISFVSSCFLRIEKILSLQNRPRSITMSFYDLRLIAKRKHHATSNVSNNQRTNIVGLESRSERIRQRRRT